MIDWPQVDPQRVDAMTRAGLWRGRTILDYLEAAVRERPGQTFVTDHNSMTGQSTNLSFLQLDQISRRVGAGLAQHGVRQGDVVAMQLPNWWEFVALHLACMRIGAVTNPLMPIFRERELRFMLSFAETRVLVIPRTFKGFDYPAMIRGLQAELPDLKAVFTVGGNDESGFEACLLNRRWEDEVDTGALFHARRPGPDDVSQICYTSGTTGEPKAVMHTYNTLTACTESGREVGVAEDSVCLMGSPLAHQTGFLFGIVLPLSLGARTVLMDIWAPDTAVRLITEEQVTFTMGATPFVSDLADSELLDQYPTRSLRLFICGGAPIPRMLVQRASERLGTNIASGWGMTENGLVTVTRVGDDSGKVFGTDGKPWPGMEVRIVSDSGKPLPTGVDGSLEVRGAANFVGYLKRPDAAGIVDGWFETGDIARLDDSGYIRLTGRAKDIIIRGGENVPVPEVETVIYEHAAVHDVAVVAMPDSRLGERGCAFVALRPGHTFTFEQMQSHLQACGMAKNHWPERLELMADLPRTPSGKIQKFRLRERAAQFGES